MSGIKTYVGSDGKLHFVDASGADSVLPFNKIPEEFMMACGISGYWGLSTIVKSDNSVTRGTANGSVSGEYISVISKSSQISVTAKKAAKYLYVDSATGTNTIQAYSANAKICNVTPEYVDTGATMVYVAYLGE